MLLRSAEFGPKNWACSGLAARINTLGVAVGEEARVLMLLQIREVLVAFQRHDHLGRVPRPAVRRLRLMTSFVLVADFADHELGEVLTLGHLPDTPARALILAEVVDHGGAERTGCAHLCRIVGKFETFGLRAVASDLVHHWLRNGHIIALSDGV